MRALNNRVLELKRHFEVDEWDVGVDSFVMTVLDELSEDLEFLKLVTETVVLKCKVQVTANDQGELVFRKK